MGSQITESSSFFIPSCNFDLKAMKIIDYLHTGERIRVKLSTINVRKSKENVRERPRVDSRRSSL